MKIVIILLILIISLGIYISASHSNNEISQINIKNYQIVVEDVSRVVTKIPSVKEIDYFETTKDIDNWFVRSDERNGIKVKRSSEYVSQGNHSMQVYWMTKGWGELVLVHFPEDWQCYNEFIFDIFNPDDESIDYELKIGDHFDASGFHPKANKFILKNTLKPGLNTLMLKINDIANKINVGSERKVIHLRFFAKDKLLYLDNMRLEI